MIEPGEVEKDILSDCDQIDMQWEPGQRQLVNKHIPNEILYFDLASEEMFDETEAGGHFSDSEFLEFGLPD